MKTLTVLAVAVAVMLAGCAQQPSPSALKTPSTTAVESPAAVASPEVDCDTAQFQPPPSLACGPAIAAALAALGAAHPTIIREEFRWGGLCPPGAPCAPPLGNAGIVIFDFAAGTSVFVYVNADAGAVVAASSPAPYPDGY